MAEETRAEKMAEETRADYHDLFYTKISLSKDLINSTFPKRDVPDSMLLERMRQRLNDLGKLWNEAPKEEEEDDDDDVSGHFSSYAMQQKKSAMIDVLSNFIEPHNLVKPPTGTGEKLRKYAIIIWKECKKKWGDALERIYDIYKYPPEKADPTPPPPYFGGFAGAVDEGEKIEEKHVGESEDGEEGVKPNNDSTTKLDEEEEIEVRGEEEDADEEPENNEDGDHEENEDEENDGEDDEEEEDGDEENDEEEEEKTEDDNEKDKDEEEGEKNEGAAYDNEKKDEDEEEGEKNEGAAYDSEKKDEEEESPPLEKKKDHEEDEEEESPPYICCA